MDGASEAFGHSRRVAGKMLGELRTERKGQQTGCPFFKSLIQGSYREQKGGREQRGGKISLAGGINVTKQRRNGSKQHQMAVEKLTFKSLALSSFSDVYFFPPYDES